MGSFASGFKMGGDMYDSSEESKRQKVLDDRATQEYGQRQDAVKRQLGIQAKTDAARTRIEGLDGGVFEGSQANFGINDGVAPQGPMPAEAYQAPSVGLQPRKATDMEYNRAFQSEALARGDMAGLQALRVTGKGFEYDDAYKNAGAKWDAMSDAEKADTIKKVSYDQGIPGHGNWVQGTGKSAGYMNYLPPGADPVKLSAKDTKQFFSITNAMEVDPARARKELEAASAQVQAVSKEVFASSAVGVKENNNTQSDIEKRDIEREKLGIYRQSVAQAGRSSGGSDDKKVPPELIAEVNGLVGKLNESRDPKEQQELRRQIINTQIKIANSQNKAFVPREDRPTAGTDPVKRLGLVKSLMEMQGSDFASASASADAMLGGGSNAGGDDLVERLKQQALDQKKNQNPRPMVVQPGENGMRPSGQAIMGDPKNFQRTNSRGLFGGISYGYVDPVTNKKYSPEEYNRLLAE